MKLRNPWGKGEWKGDWHDGDRRWTTQLRNDMKMENKEDGIFFMGYNEFCKFFSDFQVCYYHDNYKYSALKLENIQKSENVNLQFEITKGGKYYFSLNQINKRFYKKTKRYRYSNLSYIVSRKNNAGSAEYIGSNMKADKENWLVSDCKPGLYTIMIKANWKSFVRDFSFSVYGPQTCRIKRVTFFLSILLYSC